MKTTSQALRKYLLKNRNHECENCNLKFWNGENIPLSVHHIDGDAMNNKLDNLQLLCLNCHGLTPNFGRKNKKSTRTYRYENKHYVPKKNEHE